MISKLLRLIKVCGLTLAMASCFNGSSATQAPVLYGAWPTLGWERTEPEAQGMDSAKLANIVQGLHSKQGEIHSLQIVRHGALVLDAYFYPYLGDAPHDIASVTKSVTTTLIGAAIEQKHLAGLDASITRTLGRYIEYPKLQSLTVAHAAAMRAGLDCGLYPDERELMAMIQSDDWIDFTLQLPVTAEPGERFAYCSPATHLLSAILSKSLARPAAAFAQDALFKPLGFGAVHWPSDSQGISHGWGDLRLHPRDMAKIGLLYLHDGVWNGQRLLPADWVADAVTARSEANNGDGYGLGWWRPAGFDGVIAANGRGGQSISILPALDMVVVVTGSGFDLGSIAADLLESVQSTAALPANPDAVTALEQSVAQVAQPAGALTLKQHGDPGTSIFGKRFIFPDNPVGVTEIAIDQPSTQDIRFCLGLSGLLGNAQRESSCFLASRDGGWTVNPQGFREGFAAAARLTAVTHEGFTLELVEPASPNSIAMTMSVPETGQLALRVRERTGLFAEQVLVGSAAPVDVGGQVGPYTHQDK